MTIEVIIKHNNPGYNRDLEVLVFDFSDEALMKVAPDPSQRRATTIIKAGEERTFWVHSTQSLSIREKP